MDSDGFNAIDLEYFNAGFASMGFLAVDSKGDFYAGESGLYDVITPYVGRQIVKYSADGTPLINFNDLHFPSSSVFNHMILQPDDHLLLSGSITSYDSTAVGPIMRAKSNGELDHTFKPELPADYEVNEMTLLKNDAILVAGPASFIEDQYFYKLKPNGAIDPSFDFGNGVCSEDRRSEIEHILEVENGNIILHGYCKRNRSGYHDRKAFTIVIDTNGKYIADFLPQFPDLDIHEMVSIDGKQLYLSVRLATDNDILQLIRVNMPLLNPVQEQRYDLNNSMRVFPNPISDEALNLQFIDAQLGKQFNYQITEIATGRIIKNGQLNASSNNTIMVADLQKGFYLLQVQQGTHLELAKFVKL